MPTSRPPRGHRCPVKGCSESVHISRLMCPEHWMMVPAALRTSVYREYKRGKLTPEHIAAMDAAIASVNEQLGHGREP